MEAIIQVMEATIRARDPYTAGHQQRVALLACAIAEKIGLPSERIHALRLAGTIHDLGKIAMPAEILTKPDKLNEMEFAMIKTHPQVGYDILKPLKFPGETTQIILQHHERINGSGYPRGLAGEEILLEARILGVADVVEAISSHRPYRPALGLDKALEEISRNKGVLYEAQVVEACLQLFAEVLRADQPLATFALSPSPPTIFRDTFVPWEDGASRVKESPWGPKSAPWSSRRPRSPYIRPILHTAVAMVLGGMLVLGSRLFS
jgi:putative nucleotidyltransferase with HDIG domain